MINCISPKAGNKHTADSHRTAARLCSLALTAVVLAAVLAGCGGGGSGESLEAQAVAAAELQARIAADAKLAELRARAAVVAGLVLVPVPVVPIALASASTYGAFGGSAGLTNQGLNTVVNGDIGTTAVSTSVTGFHDPGPGCTYTETGLNAGLVTGTIRTAAPPPTIPCATEGNALTFAAALQARADVLAAYNQLAAMPKGPDPGAGNLADLTLKPGVYTSAAGTFMIVGGDLTLDGQGDPDARWVFQMASALTVGGPGAAFPASVILANGAQARNVFWQVGSTAIVNAGGGGRMVGTVLAQSGAAVSTAGNAAAVVIDGRVLSLDASVTLVNTVINVPAP